MQRRSFVAGLAAAGLLPATPSFAQADPLPSWNAGPVNQAISVDQIVEQMQKSLSSMSK
jgi:hypothetical protein